jgi:integrase
MGRDAVGQIRIYERKDGLTTFMLRFRAHGQRQHLTLGSEAEGWSYKRAEIELQNTLAKVRAGIWQPEAPEPDNQGPQPSFHRLASRWLKRRRHELAGTTYSDYRWRLVRHLLPFFANYRPSHITRDHVDRYIEEKLEQRQEILDAMAAGIRLRDHEGRILRPLGNESINKTLALLSAILEEAVQKGWLPSNPAAKRRLKAPRPFRPFLEPDEFLSLVHGASELDKSRLPATIKRAHEVARLRDEGLKMRDVAKRLGISMATVSRMARIAEETPSQTSLPRRAIVATLGAAGLRVSELCALDWADLDFAHTRINVRDAKTAAGVRRVEMSPWLRDELLSYRASLRAVAPHAPVFPTKTGKRRNKDNVRARVIAPAVRRANALREAAGLSSLPPGVTPHTFRHTFISFLLEARASPRYVMAQVGHSDPKTTLRIYAHLLKRDRSGVGKALDELIHGGVPSDATAQTSALYGNGQDPSTAAEAAVFGPEIGPESINQPYA